ncbi:MAG TPA: hypothetical protein VGG76_05690 [Gemmatimonadaceae bacterium]|jgi:hypothetical protein
MTTSKPVRIANIGPRERHKRLVFGISTLGVGVAIAVLLILVRAPLLWRAPLFLPFFVGAVGVFQSRDKT